MSLAANRDRPVLALIQFAFPGPSTIECHATGDTGECGHPLAECPDPGCPGAMCPACGQWLCLDCQAFRDGVQRLLATAIPLLDP